MLLLTFPPFSLCLIEKTVKSLSLFEDFCKLVRRIMKICVTLPPCSLIRVHKDIFAQIRLSNYHPETEIRAMKPIPMSVRIMRRLLRRNWRLW